MRRKRKKSFRYVSRDPGTRILGLLEPCSAFTRKTDGELST